VKAAGPYRNKNVGAQSGVALPALTLKPDQRSGKKSAAHPYQIINKQNHKFFMQS